MWNGPLRLFKDMDNSFDIVIWDRDQQPIDVSDYAFIFQMFDRHERPLLIKDVPLTVGQTSRLSLYVSSDDIANIDVGSYKWGLVLHDNGRYKPLYLEHNGTIEGTLEIGIQ